MTQFIAEICSNHNGDLERAKKLIRVARNVGCWGVKFQLFRIDQLFAPELLEHPDYDYIQERRAWELPLEWLPELRDTCREFNIKFGCTPFYLEAVDQLRPYVDFFKVASYELLWTDLLSAILDQTDKHVIVSTGMSTMEEIRQAVFCQQIRSLDAEYRISLLHCISKYPVKPADCHLSFIGRLRSEINTVARVGWSDHSVNPGVIYRAVHRYGAEIVEFHFDLDKKGWEYNGGHCWLPDEINEVALNVIYGKDADGGWHYTPSDNPERDFRAAPTDGLRPTIQKRKDLG